MFGPKHHLSNQQEMFLLLLLHKMTIGEKQDAERWRCLFDDWIINQDVLLGNRVCF